LKHFLFGFTCLLAFSAGLLHDYEPPPPLPPVEFGYTDEEARVRVAELRAQDEPYKPDTPQPGEVGYGQPQITVEVNGGGTVSSGPTYVTPVYMCWYQNFIYPQGVWLPMSYPCEPAYQQYRDFDF
jgi:hypothetical protein